MDLYAQPLLPNKREHLYVRQLTMRTAGSAEEVNWLRTLSDLQIYLKGYILLGSGQTKLPV